MCLMPRLYWGSHTFGTDSYTYVHVNMLAMDSSDTNMPVVWTFFFDIP